MHDDLVPVLIENDSPMTIDGSPWMHIKEVRVFTGEDGGAPTRAVSITADQKAELSVRTIHPAKCQSQGRIRYEPCVNIVVEHEGGPEYVIAIEHHKGNLYFRVKKTPEYIPSDEEIARVLAALTKDGAPF